MSIKLDIGATYAGLELFEIHRVIKKMRELGISATDGDLVTMARKCAEGCGGAMGSARLLDEADMLAIYRASL